MANETDDEIERAATAEFKKYADRVKDIDDLAGANGGWRLPDEVKEAAEAA
jgi:hypothetical protein